MVRGRGEPHHVGQRPEHGGEPVDGGEHIVWTFDQTTAVTGKQRHDELVAAAGDGHSQSQFRMAVCHVPLRRARGEVARDVGRQGRMCGQDLSTHCAQPEAVLVMLEKQTPGGQP